jgi:hypothetical protein
MAKTSRKRRARSKPARPSTPKTSARVKDAEADAFTRSLIAHGQAAKPGPGGKLPPGATHELVEDEDGRVRAVRRRFSAL